MVRTMVVPEIIPAADLYAYRGGSRNADAALRAFPRLSSVSLPRREKSTPAHAQEARVRRKQEYSWPLISLDENGNGQ